MGHPRTRSSAPRRLETVSQGVVRPAPVLPPATGAGPWWIAALVLAVAGLAIGVAEADQASHRLTLGFLTPVVDALRYIGSRLRPWGPFFPRAECALIGGIALAGVAIGRQRRAAAGFFLPIAAVALGALALRENALWAGGPLCLAGIAALGRDLRSSATPVPSPAAEADRLDARDGWFLALLLGIVAGYRFYALNTIGSPGDWDPEVAQHELGSLDLQAIARLGLSAPEISQGFFWYLLNYIALHGLGIADLSVRLAYAAVSLGEVPLFYFVARWGWGRRVAAIATALFAFSPVEIAWARNHYYFPLATCGLLAVVAATQRALHRPGRGASAGMAVAMGLSNFLYGSGAMGFLIPFLPAWRQWRHGKLDRRILYALAAGVLLWIGLPTLVAGAITGTLHYLPYSTVHHSASVWHPDGIDPSLSPASRILLTAKVMIQSLGSFIRELWQYSGEGTYVPIASFTAPTPFPYGSTVFALVGVAVLAASRFRLATAIALSWLIAGLLPGLLSWRYAFRHYSQILPLFALAAAIGIDRARQAWVEATRVSPRRWAPLGLGAFAVLAVANGSAYFSDRPFAPPPEWGRADWILRYLDSGTVVLVDDGYEKIVLQDYVPIARHSPGLLVLQGLPDNSWGEQTIAQLGHSPIPQRLYQDTPLRTIVWKTAPGDTITYLVSGESQFSKPVLAWLRSRHVLEWHEEMICPKGPACQLTVVRVRRAR